MKEGQKKLRHGSSRKIIVKKNTIVKFYPQFYGYLIHEIVKMIIFAMYGVRGNLISPKRRIFNEINGRKILKSIEVETTKIKDFSFKNKYLEEKFESGAFTIDDIEKSSPDSALELAKEIGRITRKLNDMNCYFVDNRSSNWMFEKNLIRTDLELFSSNEKDREFYRFCDMLSFVSSVKNQKTKKEFMKGYKKRSRLSIPNFLQRILSSYMKTTEKVL